MLRRDEAGAGWQRVVVEKPFGNDLSSAQQLNTELTRFAHEKQIYRIDHYVGKETVQNLIALRFANSLFEPLWSNTWVDHVQITMAESFGVDTAGLKLVVFVFAARLMALAVQDRVIRLEERLRMREILPADLRARVSEITREQFVGLRFASDAELPGLVRRVLGGELKSTTEIKKAVADWRGDYLRA